MGWGRDCFREQKPTRQRKHHSMATFSALTSVCVRVCERDRQTDRDREIEEGSESSQVTGKKVRD